MALYCYLGTGLEWAEPQFDEWVSPCGGLTSGKGYFPLLHPLPLLALSVAALKLMVVDSTLVEGQMRVVDHGVGCCLRVLEARGVGACLVAPLWVNPSLQFPVPFLESE